MFAPLKRCLLLLAPALAVSACSDDTLRLSITPEDEGRRFSLSWTPEGGPRTLLFPSGQRMDIVITRSDGSSCWRWSDGRMFTMALAAVTLAEGETFEHHLSWDGRCADGEPAAAGRYTATAEIPLSRLDDEPLDGPISVSETFEID